MMALLATILACAPTAEQPRVDEVRPEWGWQGEATEIMVLGDAFFPDVQVSTADVDAGRVDASFQVWLDTPTPTRLNGVQLVDYASLTGDVPEGLPVGVYDLRVVTPSGLEATLPAAFSVTETRADHLEITLEDAAFQVNEPGVIELRLEDPDHVTVPQAMAVEVRATSALDAVGVRFGEGLGGQTATEDGVGVRGTLGADGTASLLVTSSVPDDVVFTISPVDDPVVDADSALISWEAGALTRVEVVLPSAGFRATAGVPFDVALVLYDIDGNVLGPQAAEVLLYDACGAFSLPVDLSFAGPWSVTLTEACAEDTLSIAGVLVEGGVSEVFPVLAGPQTGLGVTAYPDPVVAGSGLLLVQVDAVDAYGNIVPGAVGTVTLTDSVGGLDPSAAIGQQSCGTFDDGRLLCTASPLVAASDVVLTARDDVGFVGVSNPVDVIPDVPQVVIVDVDAPTLVAGDPFAIVVGVRDAWGNPIFVDAGGTQAVGFEDDSGSIECAFDGADGDDAAFTCTVTVAGLDDVIVASVLGLEGSAPGVYPILNGGLGVVDIEIYNTTYTAGVPFSVTFTGFDDFGNLYSFPTTGASFDISDTTNSITPATAFFDADGSTAVAATITTASDSVRILASQGGVLLGESGDVTILPGPTAGFEVAVDPWLDVAVGGSASISAVDAYGNVVPGYEGTVQLTSHAGLCGPVEGDGFSGGRAQVLLDCADVGFREAIDVVDGASLTGTSDAFDVLDFGCDDGPTVEVLVGGSNELVACLVSGNARVAASAGGSVAGASPISFFHLVDHDGQAYRTTSPTEDFDYSSTGTRRITAVAVDTRACASEASALAYLGEDDGTPTGPLTLSAAAGSVSAGGSTSIDVEASDCAGDVATSGTLLVRADLGTVGGASTGSGLELTLDASGTASVDWSFPEGYSGTATAWAGTASTSALGEVEITVSGDSARPEVVSVTPSGAAEGDVESIEVVFTEAMRSLSVISSAVELVGPTGAVDVAVTLADDGTVADLAPTTSVDAGAGAWTLTLDESMRDLAGNKLDGDYSGTNADFTTYFGDVDEDLPVVSACAVDTGRFVPDGDAGAGREADLFTITPTVSAPPTWWWLVVEDAAGTRSRSLRVDGTDTGVPWDGRADDGRIVPSGAYLARLYVVDDLGNSRAVCESGVAVEQHLEMP